MEHKFYSRTKKKVIEDTSTDDKKLDILYNTIYGRILLKLVFSTRWFSFLHGLYCDSSASQRLTSKFLKEHKVDLSRCKHTEFKSFNAFFTRKEHRIINAERDELIAPCDALLSAYTIDDDMQIFVKGRMYSIKQLLKNDDYASVFKDGICLVYRLRLKDYHRYIHTHSGKIIKSWGLKGRLHTVRPLQNSNDSYFENTRFITIFDTDCVGVAAQIEVGAMLVGKIINHKTQGKFTRFKEKGYFAYGGSTIIQLYRKNCVKFDDDILHFSSKNIETHVRLGEKIGNVKAMEHIL